jgi:hypothetical protein
LFLGGGHIWAPPSDSLRLTPAKALKRTSFASAARTRSIYWIYERIAMLAKIEMIIITTTSSINVKPAKYVLHFLKPMRIFYKKKAERQMNNQKSQR